MLNKTQKRFFIVYFSFFVCMLILTAPLYVFAYNALKENIIATSEEVLSSGLEQLENELHLITIAAGTLYSNSQIATMAQMEHNINAADAYKILQANKIFSNMTDMMQLPSYIGLVLKNDTVIAGKSFYLSGESFFEQSSFSTSNAKSFPDWVKILRQQNKAYSFMPTTVSTYFREREAVLFTLSLPLNSKQNRTMLFTVLDNDDLTTLLVLPDVLEHSSLILLDANQEKLLYHDAIGAEGFVSIKKHSSTYNLTAELQIGNTIISESLRPYRILLGIGFIVYFLVGLVITIVYTISNAKPFMRMLVAAKNVYGEMADNISPTDIALTSYSYMDNFISQVDTKLKTSKITLQQQEQALKSNYFELLLQGNCYLRDSGESAQQYLPELPAKFRMALIKLITSEEMSPSEYAKKQVAIRNVLEPSFPMNTYIHFSANNIILLLPCGNNHDQMEYDHVLRIRSEHIVSSINIDIRVGVSPISDNIDHLCVLYQDLQHLLRMTSHFNSPKPFYVEEQKIASIKFDNITTRSNCFYEHTVRVQEEMALNLLNNESDMLKKMLYVEEADIQQVFFAYRSALARALALLDQAGNQIKLPEYQAHDHLDNTFDGIRVSLKEICATFRKNEEDNRANMEKAIIIMINENIAEADFFSGTVAEKFSISESTLQRIIKNATGKSFFDYLEMLRMNLACDLVCNSNDTVSQIAKQCGYVSDNTFYKAFRRKYGISPSAMRENRKDHLRPEEEAQ